MVRFWVSQGLSDTPSFKGTAGLQVVFKGIGGKVRGVTSARDGASTEPAIQIAGTVGAFEVGMGKLFLEGSTGENPGLK